MMQEKYTKILLALFFCLIPGQLLAEPNGAAQETSILLLLFGILFAGGTLVILAVTFTGFILKQQPPPILLKIGLGANILWATILGIFSLAMLTQSSYNSKADSALPLLGFVCMSMFAFMNWKQSGKK